MDPIVDPRENNTGVQPGEVVLSPEAKNLVDVLNQRFEEAIAAYKADKDAGGGVATPEIEAKFRPIKDDLLALQVTVNELTRSRTPKKDEPARGMAEFRGYGVDDPRDCREWDEAYDRVLRSDRQAPEADLARISKGNQHHRAHFEGQNALSTDFGPGGGIWVAPTVDRAITRRIVEFSPIRAEARVVPVAGGEYQGVIRTTNRDTVAKTGERVAPTEATQERRYETIKIPVHQMTASPALTQMQIDDSIIDLAAELREDVALDMAKEEARWFMKGTGSEEAEGLAVSTRITSVNSGIADDIDHASLTLLMLDLPPFYRNAQSSYAVSRSALQKLMLEEDGFGRRIWQPSNQEGIPTSLNSFRWWEGIELDAVAAGAFPVFFGNFRLGYRIVDRLGIRVIRDDLTAKPNVVFDHYRRVGGKVWLDEALRKLKVAA